MPSAEVYIFGQKYTVKGEAPEEHLRELVSYVQERINDVCDKSPSVTPTKALILAMFNIAEDMHRLKSEQDDMARNIEEKADILAGLFEEIEKKTLF